MRCKRARRSSCKNRYAKASDSRWPKQCGKADLFIGGNVGGIRYQIEDGVNGFLVSSIEEAAERIVRLLKDKKLREEIGSKARETVREKFLLSRYVEQYLDLFGAFDKNFRLRE